MKTLEDNSKTWASRTGEVHLPNLKSSNLRSGIDDLEFGQKHLASSPSTQPRLGFLGVGWIGRSRLEAIAKSDLAEIVAIADLCPELAKKAAQSCGHKTIAVDSLDELLEQNLDGLVIATPSALHAEQTITALENGVAVFCQKPLARTAAETRKVVIAAERADRLLGVDFSYRFLEGTRRIQQLIQAGELGKIFAVELAFHNAYGPGNPWFYDRNLSGGGCVIDLGIHLVDFALWMLDFPKVTNVCSSLFSQGVPLKQTQAVEDYAAARFDLSCNTTVQLSSSWRLPAGCDAIISAAFYGTKAGAILKNVDGSFHNFTAELCIGTKRQLLAIPPDDWGGRAAVDWTNRLAAGEKFDPQSERLIDVAETLDKIYGGKK